MSLLVFLCATLAVDIRTSDGTGFFELPDSVWADPSTCRAESGGDTLVAAPGAWGSRTGLIVTPAPAAGDTVILLYDILPLSVRSTAALDLALLEREPVGEAPGTAFAEPYQDTSGLVISGVKRLGFSVGHGGGMEQSTSLSISGTIAGGIEVEGVVSDENLPPGGSEAVSELDRVRLGLTGTGWSAQLGDMEWVRGTTGPLSWRREAGGFLGSAGDSAVVRVEGGAGVSGQSHRRAVFTTQEGVSGPYEFSGGTEVVPGSDELWLDGTRLTRGASADYTIDCTAGTVTFDESRLVRRDQRVEITYYSRGDGYRKTLYTAGASVPLGGIMLEASSFSESDDRERPLGFSLSEEAVGLLESTGESADSAWVDGADSVGTGEGSYSRDSLGRFVYEGPGLGDWRVTFSRPPDDSPGDYIYDSALGGFEWAGESLGTHLPRQYLEIPSTLQVGGMTVSGGSPSAGFIVETSVSRRVGNSFNPSVTTREGVATRSRLFLESDEGPGLSIALTGASPGFRPAGIWLGDSVLATWTLPMDYAGLDEIAEASAHAGVFAATGGILLADSGGRIGRGSVSASPAFGGLMLDAGLEGAGRSGTPSLADGRYFEGALGLAAASGSVRPGMGAGLRDESWPDSLAGRLATGWTETLFSLPGWESGVRLELERDWRDGLMELPFRTVRGRLETGNTAAGRRFTGSFEHSTSSWRSGGSTQADAFEADYSASGAGGWFHAVYSGSGTLSTEMEIHYRYVGEGEGSYSFDEETGEYYPDPDGDWDVYYTPGSGGAVTEEASLEAEFLTGGSLGYSVEGSADLVSRDAGGRLETFLLAGAFGSGSGGYSLEISPSWRGAATVRLLRLRGRISLDRTVYSGTGASEDREARIELSGRVVPEEALEAAWAAEYWRIDEELYSPRRRTGLRFEVDPSFEAGSGFKPGILAAYERRAEEYAPLSAAMYEVAPHVSWSLRGWSAYGSISAGYIPGDAELPVWFFEGSDTGTAWSIQGRAGRYFADGLSISLTFYGRRPAGSEWVRRAGLEGAVSF